jgi:hypothetical protein
MEDRRGKMEEKTKGTEGGEIDNRQLGPEKIPWGGQLVG